MAYLRKLSVNNITSYIVKRNKISLDFIFYILLISSFLVRAINLNYNSAFNDEAIYIVVGRMGLFTSDWWSYGASLWMAGLPYIYPTLSALAYQIGGLIGTRLLNVIFGTLLVEEIYRLTRLTALFDKKTNQIAAIIAAFLAGFSGIGIFVSKLATYDLLSFLLLIAAINSFIKAGSFTNGKYFFLTYVLIFLSFLTKITTAFFFPVLFVFSLLILLKKSVRQKKMALYYLFIPFLIGISIYFLFYFGNLITYITTHKDLGLSNTLLIINQIWKISGILIVLAIPSICTLLYFRKIKEVFSLILLALVIPVSHLILKRFATLDKHLFLTSIFLSIIIGYAISLTISKYSKIHKVISHKYPDISKDILRFTTTAVVLTFISFYLTFSYQQLTNFEHQWKNTNEIQLFLAQNVNEGNKVITENGAAVILSLYNFIFPPKDIVTFDWIDYSGFQDNQGYFQALDDRYFDFIELDNEFEGKDELKDGIRQRLGTNYSLVYNQNNFEIYKKNELK